MSSWRTSGLATALAAGLGLVTVLAVNAPANAAALADENGPDNSDWGTVVETSVTGVQADSWVVRVQGLQGILDTALFESAFPTRANAPEEQAGGKNLVDLAPGGFGLGKVSALYSRALGNKVPATASGGTTTPAPGVAYADAGGASVDIGIPYVQNPTGGTQLSPLGVHVEGISVSAMSAPGQPVKFTGGAARAYLSSLGGRLIDIPPLWPVNFGARIPGDYSRPPVALATTNEQVTTDNKGMPTLGADKHYKYDAKATSGYVNGIHASVLGTEVADVTVAHAAVIRDPLLTDKFKDKLPKLPDAKDFVKPVADKLDKLKEAAGTVKPAADAVKPAAPAMPQG
ncbi:hypothetical protein ABT160_44810 [Streptomyces sp. NPDC001941]|uniref:hypothetical protein n=1 Tax=Streptomyces sp. NPDC001941 TaxID=3154659 RepID=UPI00331BDFA0